MRILVIDDVEIQRITIRDELKDFGHEVEICASGIQALDVLKRNQFDVILTDLKMSGMSGIELLSKIKEHSIGGEVLIMTAYATIKNAVEAIHLGAYDYLTKPIEFDELKKILDHIEELIQLNKENKFLRSQLKERYSFGKIIGKSSVMLKVYKQIVVVAPENVTVLITGKTGTGKEILADTIHHNSHRSKNPLVKVSCAALSKDILESELFGHERGAFTGAHQRKIGRFELARGGTIFLDDVDDIPLESQVKLLRVLQEKVIERVGGTEIIPVDTRVLASTKVNLLTLVEEGRFRSDLYYRLNVFPLKLPPLIDRREDIPLLLTHFFKEYSIEPILISDKTMSILIDYNWKGNVRELKNLVERLSIICKCNPIEPECLPLEILEGNPRFSRTTEKQSTNVNMTDNVSRYEYGLIQEALNKANGNKAEAARILGIPVSTLKSKLTNTNND
ncbi:MAG: sigma-54-dependent Fis family transcriptional regulator [Candidatus Marinimicrobia bacterium]|nr:sigma-54-dependent Fis family transcriptional regulator [Candidatus Neomarinimicrobiota bacterium]